jgi:hypothetical protein
MFPTKAEVFHSEGYDEVDTLLKMLRKRLIAFFAISRTRAIVNL